MTFEFLQKSILVLLGVGFIYQCQASIPDQTNGTNDTVSSVTFASHCRGPKGRSQLGLSMRGEYLGYEFNRTNYLREVEDLEGRYDTVNRILEAAPAETLHVRKGRSGIRYSVTVSDPEAASGGARRREV